MEEDDSSLFTFGLSGPPEWIAFNEEESGSLMDDTLTMPPDFASIHDLSVCSPTYEVPQNPRKRNIYSLIPLRRVSRKPSYDSEPFTSEGVISLNDAARSGNRTEQEPRMSSPTSSLVRDNFWDIHYMESITEDEPRKEENHQINKCQWISWAFWISFVLGLIGLTCLGIFALQCVLNSKNDRLIQDLNTDSNLSYIPSQSPEKGSTPFPTSLNSGSSIPRPTPTRLSKIPSIEPTKIPFTRAPSISPLVELDNLEPIFPSTTTPPIVITSVPTSPPSIMMESLSPSSPKPTAAVTTTVSPSMENVVLPAPRVTLAPVIIFPTLSPSTSESSQPTTIAMMESPLTMPTLEPSLSILEPVLPTSEEEIETKEPISTLAPVILNPTSDELKPTTIILAPAGPIKQEPSTSFFTIEPTLSPAAAQNPVALSEIPNSFEPTSMVSIFDQAVPTMKPQLSPTVSTLVPPNTGRSCPSSVSDFFATLQNVKTCKINADCAGYKGGPACCSHPYCVCHPLFDGYQEHFQCVSSPETNSAKLLPPRATIDQIFFSPGEITTLPPISNMFATLLPSIPSSPQPTTTDADFQVTAMIDPTKHPKLQPKKLADEIPLEMLSEMSNNMSTEVLMKHPEFNDPLDGLPTPIAIDPLFAKEPTTLPHRSDSFAWIPTIAAIRRPSTVITISKPTGIPFSEVLMRSSSNKGGLKLATAKLSTDLTKDATGPKMVKITSSPSATTIFEPTVSLSNNKSNISPFSPEETEISESSIRYNPASIEGTKKLTTTLSPVETTTDIFASSSSSALISSNTGRSCPTPVSTLFVKLEDAKACSKDADCLGYKGGPACCAHPYCVCQSLYDGYKANFQCVNTN